MHLHDAKYEVSPAITCIKVNVTLISSGFFCPTMDNIAPVLSMVQPHMACNNYSAAAYLLPEERCSCFPLRHARAITVTKWVLIGKVILSLGIAHV